MGKMVYIPSKKVAGDDTHWPKKKRMEVIISYLSTGNLRLTAALHGISYNTVQRWKRYPWWEEMIQEIHASQTIKTNSSLSKIVDKTIDHMNDRLDNGDPILDSKTGKILRIPPKLRDVKSVAKDLLEQQRYLKKEIYGKQNEKESETINSRLLSLAEKFAEMATGKKIQPQAEIIDVEFEELNTLNENKSSSNQSEPENKRDS